MKITLKSLFIASLLTFTAVGLSACSPEVGSKEWCEDMKKKDKGDWTAKEAGEFAKSCVF